jgi:hypothetical protein
MGWGLGTGTGTAVAVAPAGAVAGARPEAGAAETVRSPVRGSALRRNRPTGCRRAPAVRRAACGSAWRASISQIGLCIEQEFVAHRHDLLGREVPQSTPQIGPADLVKDLGSQIGGRDPAGNRLSSHGEVAEQPAPRKRQANHGWAPRRPTTATLRLGPQPFEIEPIHALGGSAKLPPQTIRP